MSLSKSKDILTEVDESGLLVVTLNRPEKNNAMRLDMWRELGEIFSAVEKAVEVHGVILTGAGGNFCSGADISEFDDVRSTPEQGMEYDRINDEAVLAIRDCPKPVCAAISGYAVGGGMSLALACDFRVSETTAKMGITAGRLGLVYSIMDCSLLMEKVGLTNSKRILMGSDIFDYKMAKSLGLVDFSAKENALVSAREVLAPMMRNAPLSQAGNKAILNAIAVGAQDVKRNELEQLISEAFDSEDYLEGRRAFKDRRQPNFKGY